ncbi:response regulator transcription factor [Variovorax paradoxus]|nr:response regulator transcription factor [Variovorax paradoxus]
MAEPNSSDRNGHHGRAVYAGHGIARCGPSCSENDHRLSDDTACPITIMIASDRQALLLAWMARLMHEPGIEFHAESFTDPARLGYSIEQRSPAVMLLDKAMLDRLDGESIQTIRALFENTRVLLLWDELCDGLVVDLLRYRFHGFLLATWLPEVCLKSIRAVSRGELWMSRVALASAIADLLPASPSIVPAKPPHSASSSTTLTRREQQIVELLRCGCTNKEIANQLGVVEDTVKKHLQSVFRKLGVRRRALVALRPHPAASNSI